MKARMFHKYIINPALGPVVVAKHHSDRAVVLYQVIGF